MICALCSFFDLQILIIFRCPYYVVEGVKVKAAGGISSFDDAEKFMSLGADRPGTSRLVKIMKNTDNGAGY